ncbi:MAG: quinolinate synthase NadA, partial [Deltaproteobacteria bacterium]|nr:quinolinate synthase NadA [Deltaproteobacteria bacterium]
MQETSHEDKKRIEQILALKESLGEELIILAHHYQRKEIVDLGDYRGDSFGLSQKAATDKAARYIVFCGVHFMAESAEILSQPHQRVQIPDMEAGCWMADMANSVTVEKAWQQLGDIIDTDDVAPLVYMNADAEIKAFCGDRGGLVCTSSNAPKAFEWAFSQRQKIFFFPDQHLGRNTGNRMNISPDRMNVGDPEKPRGGNTAEQIKQAR